MNKFEKHLLQLAFENFLKNGSSYTEFLPINIEDAIYYSDAIEYLEESEHVISHVNNFANGPVNPLNGDTLICYELTEQGVEFAKSTLVP
ncbi:hypothetical protein AAGS61_01775 [Lysinibacillus sp. KU-BSD001]|uniref:hypothetical protein n=1 Tax=Lysinibacillus sp. KU-BSD001 TaxID=3141328 RepID=UPI0036E02175